MKGIKGGAVTETYLFFHLFAEERGGGLGELDLGICRHFDAFAFQYHDSAGDVRALYAFFEQ